MLYKSVTKWKLAGYWPYTMLLGNAMETGAELAGVTDTIDAEVPGSVYRDLLRAGIIEDPYFEMNSLKCEWVSNRWWIYSTGVTLDEALFNGGRIYLVFKGIDYKAHVYFNGALCAIREGMYRELRIDITKLAKPGKENKISVVLENAPEETAQIGYTSETRTQKARFNYKWDFSTRLVNLGLYDDVRIEYDGGARISEKRIECGRTLKVNLKIDAARDMDCEIKPSLLYQGKLSWQNTFGISLKKGENLFSFEIELKNPRLWHPNGYGGQPLYDLSIDLVSGGARLDCYEQKTGFRTLEYVKNEGAGDDALPYTVKINGKKIYLKGVNMVPLDHMYGCVTRERYRKFLRLAKAANVTLVRVWGGGLIEKEDFYSLCDEYGIMVWQEFIQSSSGIDNIPSRRPEFLRLLSETAAEAVKEKRNHIALTFWCGGNELMDKNSVPSTYQDENIAMLKALCDELDPQRLMLPTSASGPTEWIDANRPGRNHDVHGPWKYGGTEKHYAYFNASDSMLHSEFGNDGMANLKTLKKILSKKNLRVTTVAENVVWRHHGEWWDTYQYRDRALFGGLSSLEDDIAVSQYMQAEGLRYAIESNRRRVWQNSGSIVWQFNEPWPNVACTSLVDYYGVPKLAYAFVADAYEPVHASLRYDKLVYARGERFTAGLFAHNDLKGRQAKLCCTIRSQSGETLAEFAADPFIPENACEKACDISASVPDGDVFFAECTVTAGKKTYKNTYMFFISDGGKLSVDAVKAFIADYRKKRR